MANHCSNSMSHDEKHEKQDAEIKDMLGHIRNKILVMSGKGGVGKSSIAAFLAISLARMFRIDRKGLFSAPEKYMGCATKEIGMGNYKYICGSV